MTDRDNLIREARAFLGGLYSSDYTARLVARLADALESPPVSPDGGSPEIKGFPSKPGYATEGERRQLAVRAACMGALAAALGEPLHAVARSGFESRTIGGDAWEEGHGYITSSGAFAALIPVPPPVSGGSR